jgi:pimeloyl-ACP methyl ester carboxylesterase
MTDPGQSITSATVCDGCTDTIYLRSGRGTPVILLAEPHETREALLRRLAHCYRVIAPDHSSSPGKTWDSGDTREFTDWLRGFLDALGLTRTSIVAVDGFAAQARGFALLEPERVERLVIVDSHGTPPLDELIALLGGRR